MKLKLPKVAQTMLKQRGGSIDTTLRATKMRLLKTCTEHTYAHHDSVIAFEAAFGGLIIPDKGRKIKKTEPYWLFGTYACLTSGAHVSPRGGSKARKLVPVVYSPNDIIYYLDEKGRAYAEDTIEDESAVLCADNATAMLCQIIFHDAIFTRQETSLDLAGLQGDEFANRLALKLVAEASGKDRRFFSDAKGEMLVVEDIKAKRTHIAAATKKLFKLVQPPASRTSSKTPPELIPYLGKEYIRMVGEQRTSLPEFFEHLPDLRTLDVSINRIATLPESLWRATQLTSLDLGFNPLTVLPDGVGNLKALRSLHLRGLPVEKLPDTLGNLKNLTKLILTECENLDVDAALLVIAKLPKLQSLSLPLSHSLSSLAPLANLPLKSLFLNGARVKSPARLPSGLGQLKKLTDLDIEYADDIAQLPKSAEDIRAMRLLFSKKFTDEDIRQSVAKQPEKRYLKEFVKTL